MLASYFLPFSLEDPLMDQCDILLEANGIPVFLVRFLGL